MSLSSGDYIGVIYIAYIGKKMDLGQAEIQIIKGKFYI